MPKQFRIGETVIINNKYDQPARPDGFTCGMKGTVIRSIGDRVLISTSPSMKRWYKAKNILKEK